MQQQRRRGRVLLRFLALGVLAGVALMANPAQAVDAPGPYYADPAWDQKLPALTRFVVLTNWNSEAVLDTETGLVWERSPDPAPTAVLNWAAARLACTARTIGNRKGWRLPSVHELSSLIHPSVATGPELQPGHPFLTVQSDFPVWSATTSAAETNAAWYVNFGGSFGSRSKADTIHTWCVRGGMHAEAY